MTGNLHCLSPDIGIPVFVRRRPLSCSKKRMCSAKGKHSARTVRRQEVRPRRGVRIVGRRAWRAHQARARAGTSVAVTTTTTKKKNVVLAAAHRRRMVKPVNFDFDDPDSDGISRTEFLSLVESYDETLRDFGEGEIVHGRVVNIRENEVLSISDSSPRARFRSRSSRASRASRSATSSTSTREDENQDGLIRPVERRAPTSSRSGTASSRRTTTRRRCTGR